MDVNQVLESTLSPDLNTRQNAEQQLEQAATVDFSGYLTTLAQALGNDQAPSHIRTAAGIALKNCFSAREYSRLQEVQRRWLESVDPAVKKSVKELALNTLGSTDGRAGQSAAQFIASIAAIEIPQDQWPELMPALVQNVGNPAVHLKQASLTTIGFICETESNDLRDSLSQHSNAILTAVVQGARKEEPSNDVRIAAINALGNSLEFVRTNFENEGERNFIMQVICEATQAQDERIQQGAFACLNRIMSLYYDRMKFYMEKALFGLTVIGMRSEEEDVAKLAVEFWCTVCEEELAIEDDNAQARAENSTVTRPMLNFTRVATPEVIPVLLQLLTKQDEDAADDDYNLSRAAYQCLQLWAQVTQDQIIPGVLSFVETHLRSENWHSRDAAVSAFGAIMDGPDARTLTPLVKQALPVFISMMEDKVVNVKDSAAYALGRICEFVPESIDQETHLQPLITSLFNGLSSSPKMAGSCCWALMSLAERIAGDKDSQQNALSIHFRDSVQHILQVTESNEVDHQLRTAAYEVLNTFIRRAAIDSLPVVANLSDVILQRLEKTIPLTSQVVSIEDRMVLEEIQTSLSSVIFTITERLDQDVKPQADRIMQIFLQLLQTLSSKSNVPEAILAAIGILASSVEEDFLKYMESFVPFLYNALGNQDEPSLCSVAIGVVSDITRALGEKAQPYCDSFMNYLLKDLGSTTLGNQFKPAILQCFGDIAQAIGGHFENYLSVVPVVLRQAADISATPEGPFELIEYVISLREGVMDAWDGIILAMKSSGKSSVLQPHVESIFSLLNIVFQDPDRSESLSRSSMGVIGDLAEAFPNGEIVHMFRSEWILTLIRDTRSNRSFSPRTNNTARWAREQIKRQTAAADTS